jgi:hypothetical protein
LAQVSPDRTPLHGTGYERYSPSFRYPSFSETRLPAYGVLGNSVPLLDILGNRASGIEAFLKPRSAFADIPA